MGGGGGRAGGTCEEGKKGQRRRGSAGWIQGSAQGATSKAAALCQRQLSCRVGTDSDSAAGPTAMCGDCQNRLGSRTDGHVRQSKRQRRQGSAWMRVDRWLQSWPESAATAAAVPVA